MVEPVQRIGDYPFDISYMCYDESRYDEFLNTKHNEMRCRFQALYTTMGLEESSVPIIDVIASPPRNCRQKCRFAIRRKHDLGITDGVGPEDGFVHAMWDEGRPTVLVEAFPIASVQIYNTMPILLEVIQSKPEYESLTRGFASVHYLSTLSGSLLITMNYNNNESEAFADESDGTKCAWRVAAESLYEELLARNIPSVQSLSLLGRTRGIKIVIGQDYVYETLHLGDGRSLQYKQVEEGFSNPNSVVNQRALQWLCDVAQQAAVPSGDSVDIDETSTVGDVKSKIDLLEMYCGNGNHTVALAAYFNRVMGVEINPNLCAAARENFELNGITNASIVVCDSGRFATQILRTKKYILYAPTPAAAVHPAVSDSAAPTHPAVSDSAAPTHPASSDPAATELSSDGAGAGRVISIPSDGAANGETDPAAVAAAATADPARRASRRQPHLRRVQLSKPVRVPEYVFSFGAVLVDPPRCGLDSLTLSLVANYDHIIYISCCPESLVRDLTQLLRTHTLQRVALFDQFAHTPHIETGVWLRIRGV